MSVVFHEVLEAVETLPPPDQQLLLEILQRRMQEHRRRELLQTVREAEEEFARGECQPMTVDELMSELTS